jgi:hypothetical protein
MIRDVDRLREDDLQRARSTPPGERLLQALELMVTGIRIKRAALEAENAGASAEEIEALLQRWLERDA